MHTPRLRSAVLVVLLAAVTAGLCVAAHDSSSAAGTHLDTEAILATAISKIATTSRCRARMRGRFFSNHKTCYDMTEEDKMGIAVDVTVRAECREGVCCVVEVLWVRCSAMCVRKWLGGGLA